MSRSTACKILVLYRAVVCDDDEPLQRLVFSNDTLPRQITVKTGDYVVCSPVYCRLTPDVNIHEAFSIVTHAKDIFGQQQQIVEVSALVPPRQ